MPPRDLADWFHRVEQLRSAWVTEQPVELVQTHISAVLLGKEHVLKLKKPVDFGFLNYSTLEARFGACQAEVALNRRLAPDTYVAVLPIYSTAAGARLDGPGKIVDYAVLMKRLPAAQMLDAMLARGEVTEGLVGRIATRLAEFHSRSPRDPSVERWGEIGEIEGLWRENFVQTRPFIGRTIETAAFEAVESWIHGFLQTRREALQQRVSEGRIVDGHGDLRCESICVPVDAAAQLIFFDCIEFSQRLRCCDAASEVAFLAMDLAARGRPDLGYGLTTRYAEASGDTGMWKVLPFYGCYRAWVRGKVLSFRLDETEFTAAQKKADAARAAAFFDLARRYATPLKAPALILVTGLSGAGKTTMSRSIAHELGLLVASADEVRHDLFGEEKQPAAFEEGPYSAEATELTYTELLRRAEGELAGARPVVVDGTFLREYQRENALALACRFGVRLRFIECMLSPEATRARIEARQHLQLRESAKGQSDADWQIHLRQRETYETQRAGFPADRLLLDMGQPLADAVREATDWLRGS